MELLDELGRFFGESGAPASLSWAVDPGLTLQTPLRVQEERLVEGAVAKRQREFRAGRNLAHRLLRQRHSGDCTLLRCPNGAPCWPASIVGSLSHCDDLALCAVADCADTAMLGLDVECGAPLEANLLNYIMNEGDRQYARQHHLENGAWGKRVFSAKEAAYKALFPRHQVVLEFTDLSIRPIDNIEASSGRFRVTPNGASAQLKKLCSRLEGRWLTERDHVFTMVWACSQEP